MNRYAVGSPRWFGGTSPALLFCMCCVSTAYQWSMGDAHAAHKAHEWRCRRTWCRVWEPDHCVSTAQVSYAQHTSHIPARGDQRDSTAYDGRMYRTCRTYKYTSFCSCHNVNAWAVNGTCKCPVEYLNVQFNLGYLISHVHHRNDIILITGRMIGYL